MRRLDDFLIDRVFQKIADALHHHASCYAIAGFLLTGCGLTAVMAGVDRLVHGDSVALALMFVYVWFFPPFLIRAAQLERRWASGNDVLPDERNMFWVGRTFALFWAVLSVSFGVLTWLHGMQIAAMFNFSWLLFLAAIYFQACTPKRPRRQTQRQLAWGSSR